MNLYLQNILFKKEVMIVKIEKVNDRQIRCTLTKKDLEKRDLKLSEIAYGNEKVKALFRDMMRMAAHQYGFEAEDIPLMIEVIPFAECAVIIVTKVEDPDELDTRFSKFAPSVHREDNPLSSALEEVFGSLGKPENLIDLFKKMQTSNTEEEVSDDDYEEDEINIPDLPSPGKNMALHSTEKKDAGREYYFYRFSGLSDLLNVSKNLAPRYHGVSSLFKEESKDMYLLYFSRAEHSIEEYRSFCNLLEEYGSPVPDNGYLKYYVAEHYAPLMALNAIETLAQIANA